MLYAIYVVQSQPLSITCINLYCICCLSRSPAQQLNIIVTIIRHTDSCPTDTNLDTNLDTHLDTNLDTVTVVVCTLILDLIMDYN